MKQKIALFLSLSEHEIPRVAFSWILKFLLHTTTVLGFTIILALFVGEFGLENLPFLFVAQASFAITGTFALSAYLKKFSVKKSLLIGSIIFVLVALLGYFFVGFHPYIFFSLMIVGYSVIVTQLNILFSLFIEELFSPLESERTFPIIESAEPVGGIFAGLIAGIGVSFFHISPLYFILIWGGVGLLLIPVLLYFYSALERVPKPHSRMDHVEHGGIISEFKTSWGHISINPFLKSLFWGVLIQWFAFSIIEFLYSSSLALEFTHDVPVTGESHEENSEVVEELTHGMGLFHIAIYGILLFFQVFIARKIQRSMGVVQTILMHPVVIFFCASIMTVSFSFWTALLSKGSYEVFGGPSRNAYHSSFYVFRPHVRVRAKEFLEGIIRPAGMLLGIGLVIVLQYLLEFFAFERYTLFVVLSFIVTFAVGVRLMFALKTRAKYTLLARKNLETRGPAPEKFDAIEILSQKGHENSTASLIKILRMRTEKAEIKVQVLKTLANIVDVDAIPEILNSFDEEDITIKIQAVKTLGAYSFEKDNVMHQAFSKYRIIDSLQQLFFQTKSKKVKAAVIQFFKNIQYPEIIPFLLKALETEDEETLLGVIQVCALFKDVSAIHYLEKFINHKNSLVKAEAIIAMWQFVSYRLRLTIALSGMFESSDTRTLMSAIYVVGEIKLVFEIPRLLKILKSHTDIHVKKHIYVALAKMEHEAAIHSIVDMMVHPDKTVSSSVRKLLFAPSVENNLKKIVKHQLEAKVSHHIHTLLKDEESEILEEMKTSTLHMLHHAYEILGEKKEMIRILEILDERLKQKKSKEKEVKNTITDNGKISLEDLL